VRRVVGDSMAPTLTPGSIVIALNVLAPRPGDIVVAWAKGREVIKRVHDVNEAGIELRGDNASHSTDSRQYGRINPSDIYGRVVYVKATT